jgi:hypothetical protein
VFELGDEPGRVEDNGGKARCAAPSSVHAASRSTLGT